jgi:hypothetical protein
MTKTMGTFAGWMTAGRDNWADAAPTRKLAGWLFMGLALGLVAGPLISNAYGWQVTADAARVQAAAAVLDSKAEICVARARAAYPAAAGLDWGARRELASQWAVMPGSTFADADVTTACTQGLAR